jgi:hypothetical protein
MLLPALTRAEDLEVDVELFLAVDVSRSMSMEELEIQRHGYAQALASPDVLAAIRNGLLGRIAVTYVEWAGDRSHRVVVPWSLVETREQAEAVAGRIASTQTPGMRRTSISGVLGYAMADFDDNGYRGLRRVVDVSGDGPNNQGRPVREARDRVVSAGITINGLPLMTTDMLSEFWGIPDLDVYYTNCVIGGPGAFVIPVQDWEEFGPAVKRKLILEISALPARVVPVQYAQPAPYDCLIGEKLREQNRSYFDIP